MLVKTCQSVKMVIVHLHGEVGEPSQEYGFASGKALLKHWRENMFAQPSRDGKSDGVETLEHVKGRLVGSWRGFIASTVCAVWSSFARLYSKLARGLWSVATAGGIMFALGLRS